MSSTARDGERPAAPTVTLTVPADSVYLSVLRTAAVCLAERLDLTLDEVDDLRIVVDETAAIALVRSDVGAPLAFALTAADEVIVVEARALSSTGGDDPPEGFSWSVLTALSESPGIEVRPHEGAHEGAYEVRVHAGYRPGPVDRP